MGIIKNEIPILEFDTDTEAVIMPTHEHFDLKLPKKAVYAFLGEHVDNYAKSHECKQVATFVSETKLYPVYVTEYKGEEICLCQAPVGAAAAALSRYVDIDAIALKAIEETLSEHGLKYIEVMTWSTDGFYRETKEKVAYRKAEGCAVVEMECSALAACAKMRGAVFGEILFTADSLADVENYDERNWGGDSFAYALELCLDATVKF